MGEEYRRQFILGDRIIKDDWTQTRVNGYYFLSTQKDLEINQVNRYGKELTLIGYIINPHEPSNTNYDCLEAIFNKCATINDLINELYIYSGRFIIIGSFNNEIYIVTDPCGLRQVYYTSKEGKLWFASQPNILADYLDIPKRQDGELNSFITSSIYEGSERSWVGDDCIYESVYHLMPNHYYDVQSRSVERYWVNRDRENTFQVAVSKAANILKGSMDAISKRGELIQGLTAGWDSRMLLAASRDVKDDIQYYNSLANNIFKRNADLKIALKLSEDLNLKLHVIDQLDDVREDIEDKIKHDVTQGRDIKKTRTIQYFYDNFQGKINVNGNISEIVRNFYGTTHPSIDVDYLVGLTGYDNVPFVRNHIIKWMENIPAHILEDIEFPDLLYWEQKMGNWCAMQKAEQDIAIEDFSPFNNRQLLMTLYCVEKKYRKPGSYILYIKIMEKLWKDTLSQPINPEGLRDHMIKLAKKLMSNEMRIKVKKLIG